MITCDVPPESSWPKEVKCAVQNADGTWVYCLLDAYKIQPDGSGWIVKEEYAEEIRSLEDNRPFLQNPRFPGPAPEGDDWKHRVMTRSEPAPGESVDPFDFPDAPVGGYSEEEIEAESRRDWALRWLAENLTVWPRSLNDPAITRGEDGDPASSEDFWWSESSPGEPGTEIVLCWEKGDSITRQEWSEHRRQVLGRPEQWPDEAGMGINEATPEEEEAFRAAEERAKRQAEEAVKQGPGPILLDPATGRSEPIQFKQDWRPSRINEHQAWRRQVFPMVNDAPIGDMDALEDYFAERLPEDPGRHYRKELRVRLTGQDIERGLVVVKLDPYRICDLYRTGGGPREHLVKKGLRGEEKGQTERELVADLRAILDRWEEKLDEDDRIDYR